MTDQKDQKEEAKKEEAPAEATEDKKEEVKAEEPKPASPSQGGEEKKEEEAPAEAPKPEEKKEEKPEPSGKFKDLIKQIEELSVLELADLVKELEDRFGVSAAAPVAVASVAGGAAGAEGGAEEKSLFAIELADAGSNKIGAIKAVREVLPELGLKEAKDLVEAAPKVLKENVKKEEAEEYKKKLEEAGAKVNLK